MPDAPIQQQVAATQNSAATPGEVVNMQRDSNRVRGAQASSSTASISPAAQTQGNLRAMSESTSNRTALEGQMNQAAGAGDIASATGELRAMSEATTDLQRATSEATTDLQRATSQAGAGGELRAMSEATTNLQRATSQAGGELHTGAMTGWVATPEQSNPSRNGAGRLLPHDGSPPQVVPLPHDQNNPGQAVPLVQATGAVHNTAIQSAVAGLARAGAGPLQEDGALPGNAASQPQSNGQVHNTGRGATPQ